MAKIKDTSTTDLELSSANESHVGNNRSLRIAEKEKRKNEAEDPFLLAVKYFSEVETGTPVKGNDAIERNLVYVERVAYSEGLPPEAISIMLEFAMSLRMGTSPFVRVLKCLIPATLVPQGAVVRAVTWLCVGKIPTGAQMLFFKWVLTVFDMIDAKERLRGIYGFIFNFVTEENLCPYVCHLLYLLTRKENVQISRVRKLMDLQSRMGRQPFLSNLLSLYKVFCPEMVTLSLSSQMKGGFRNHNNPWKAMLVRIQRKSSPQDQSILNLGLKGRTNPKKRKHRQMELPVLRSAVHTVDQPQIHSYFRRKMVPLSHISSLSHLMENLHLIELPAQMGTLLGSSLTLHYLDCVQDESAFHRLDFWLGHVLHEEFLFCSDDAASQGSEESRHFLNRLLATQNFLQEGFSSTEAFLYKFLSIWDGSFLRTQILGLLSSIPMVTSSCISQLLFQPLMQLYFTSSVYFKCAVMDCLHSMLKRWLTWHSVYAPEEGLDISINSHTSVNMTLSAFKDSVMELVHFVGRLASVGLQLEGCHALLLQFILDFYETVCDMFLKYGLPLLLIPPAGVFYPAFLATDPISVDRLAYIMYRYKMNFISAKSQEKKSEAFHISRQVYHEFNSYLVFMVNTLWNSKMFQPGMALELGEELLAKSKVPQPWSRFNFIHHPAFLSYALYFHRKCWPESRDVDLNSIKSSKPWGWYLEYLFSQGFEGLKLFIQSSVRLRSSTGQKDHQPSDQK